jgi:hypothetical protein
MRPRDTTSHFVGIIAILAIVSAYSAFATPDPMDAEPTAFEINASAAQ